MSFRHCFFILFELIMNSEYFFLISVKKLNLDANKFDPFHRCFRKSWSDYLIIIFWCLDALSNNIDNWYRVR